METLLIIDDEDAVRKVASEALGKQGYNVIEAENGERGLDILRKEGDTINLIVMDIGMPGLNGRELVQAIQRITPTTPLIVWSGYLDHELLSNHDDFAIAAVLRKPFTIDSLATTIRDILDN